MSGPKVAIVTGGASGMGLACAERLAADGRSVAIWDANGAAAESAAAKIAATGATAIGQHVDVGDRATIDAALADLTERIGRPTILVNSAGITGFDSFIDIPLELWERILKVNLTGTFLCCQAVVPGMIEEGWGRIVNISSSSVHGGAPRMAHYVASKSGVVGLTKALSLELAPLGITVNVIPPGFIDTPMLRGAAAEGSVDMDRSTAATPVGRPGRGEDIAHACAFLVSEDAGYITGQSIGVNGGRNPSP